MGLVAVPGTGYALPRDGGSGPEVPDRPRTPTPPPSPTCFGLAATIVRTTPGTIMGTAGRDVIVGSPGNDVIYGLGGDDVICGMGGNDMIDGGDGNDRLSGGDGTDQIIGGPGLDSCYGESLTGCELPLRITRGQIENVVDSTVSGFISGTDLYWGHIYGRRVEATRKDYNTLAIDLDLAYSVDNWFDPEVDVDFDLDFSCTGGTINAQPRNVAVHVDSSWYSDVLSLGIVELVDSRVRDGVAAQLGSSLGPVMAGGFGACPSIQVQTNGDVVFDGPVS